jgi:hypothetical protein
MASRSNSAVWMGWVIFAALMMMVIGVVNVLQGIIALVSPGRTVVAQDRLYVVNLNGWGLTLLIFGAVLVCVGLGLMTAKSWARWSAMILVGLHAVIQIAWLGAYPLWALLMIALDVVVLYALAAHWPDMGAMSDEYAPPTARTGEHDTVGARPTSGATAGQPTADHHAGTS